MERMDEERGPVTALHLAVNGTKKGRPKKQRLKEVLEYDMISEVCKGWMHKIVKDGH